MSVSSSRYSLVDSFETVVSRLAHIYRWFPSAVTGAVDACLKSKHAQLLEWMRQLKNEISHGWVSVRTLQSIYAAYVHVYNRMSFKLTQATLLNRDNKSSLMPIQTSDFSLAESRLATLRPQVELVQQQLLELSARRLANLALVPPDQDLNLKYKEIEAQILVYVKEKSNNETESK